MCKKSDIFYAEYSFSIFTQEGAFVFCVIENHFSLVLKHTVLGTISKEFVFFLLYEEMTIISVRPKPTLSLQTSRLFVQIYSVGLLIII